MKQRTTPATDTLEPASCGQITAAEVAYRRLREMIVTGVLEPGEVVNEQELVERLGIGRTPVREAIQRLRWQHLMTVFPRRGLAIAKLGLEDIHAIFETRQVVEQRSAELAAVRCDPDEAARLLALARRLDATARTQNHQRFLPLDYELHVGIAHASRNPLLAESAEQLLTLSNWAWHRYFRLRGSLPSDYLEHGGLAAAIAERDAERAGALMVAHVRRSHDLVRSVS